MKRALSIFLCLGLFTISVSCSKKIADQKRYGHLSIPTTESETETETETESSPSDMTIPPTDADPVDKNGTVELRMTILSPYKEIDDYHNDIQEIITEKTGVRLHEESVSGITEDEAIDVMIASGDLPDLLYAGAGLRDLYTEDWLVPWDDYLYKYENLRALYTDKQWELFRQEDGHIYWANSFDHIHGESKETLHKDFAFWIQVRVLQWAGYPLISTLDDYFTLLENYYSANKVNEDGTPIVPFTTIASDWRYIAIESAPQLLDGYPFDGSVIVNKTDPSLPQVEDYNTTPTAKKYYQKLNEFYQKGLMPTDFDKMLYDEYIELLSTGSVLGLSDEYWDFGYTMDMIFKDKGFDKLGYTYVPLGLTIDQGTENHYHDYYAAINNLSGVAVTTACYDPDLAFSFMDMCLDQDIQNLRFWGIEGEDYLVDSNGLFYRTDAMRASWANDQYLASHACTYGYLPFWKGTSDDGINAMLPEEQTTEFFSTLPEPVLECMSAYGYTTYVDFLRSPQEERDCWYPMMSYSNSLSAGTPAGKAFMDMQECKHTWIPELVKNPKFDSTWDKYCKAYENCHPESFLQDMQEELDRRVANDS